MERASTILAKALVSLKMTDNKCKLCGKNRLAKNNETGVCRKCQQDGSLRKIKNK